MLKNRGRNLYLVLLASLVLVMATTTAASAAMPKYIYYQTSADGDMVKADYEAASDAFDAGNSTMWNALKSSLLTALRSAQPVIVETTDQKIVNWLDAAMGGSTWQEAQSNPTYLNPSAPVAAQELRSDGTTGSVADTDLFEVLSID